MLPKSENEKYNRKESNKKISNSHMLVTYPPLEISNVLVCIYVVHVYSQLSGVHTPCRHMYDTCIALGVNLVSMT